MASVSLLWGSVWRDEHLAKLLELLRTPYLLREEWKLNDVEELVVELVRLLQVLLLHLVPYLTMLAVRVCECEGEGGANDAVGATYPSWGRGAG